MRSPSPARSLLRALSLLLLCLSALAFAREEEGAAPGIIHLRVEGPLDIGTLGLLQRGVREARAQGSEVVLVEIDTPGGSIDLMIKFARQIEEASSGGVLTAAWIRGEATSAGVLVSLACDRIFMAPTSTMGSSTPVLPGPTGMQAIPEEGGLREKVNSLVRSEFRAIAVENGRSPQLAEAMVDATIEVREVRVGGERRLMTGTEWEDSRIRGEDPELLRTISPAGRLVNLTAQEAVELGMADGVARNLDEVLARMGRAEQRLITMERSRSEDLLAFLSQISPILLTIGLLLGYTELKTQGFGIAGILAIACFAVVFTGKYLVGLADVPHLVLLFLGVVGIAVELFVLPGQLWPGILGGLLLFGSLIAMEMGTDFDFSSAYVRDQALGASLRLSLVAVVAVAGALVLSHFLPDTPILRRLVQTPSVNMTPEGRRVAAKRAGLAGALAHVGAHGTALTDLRPVGKVVLDSTGDRDYEARAEGEAIDAGMRVRVVQVQGDRLVVEDAREGIA